MDTIRDFFNYNLLTFKPGVKKKISSVIPVLFTSLLTGIHHVNEINKTECECNFF